MSAENTEQKLEKLPKQQNLIDQIKAAMLNGFVLLFGWIEEEDGEMTVWCDRYRKRGISFSADLVKGRAPVKEKLVVFNDFEGPDRAVEWVGLKTGTSVRVQMDGHSWETQLRYDKSRLVALVSPDEPKDAAISGITFSFRTGRSRRPALSFWAWAEAATPPFLKGAGRRRPVRRPSRGRRSE